MEVSFSVAEVDWKHFRHDASRVTIHFYFRLRQHSITPIIYIVMTHVWNGSLAYADGRIEGMVVNLCN